MQIKFLTLYTSIAKTFVLTHQMGQANLALVIGTSNSLYKVISQGNSDQVRINEIIIDTWLEQIDPLVKKIEQLMIQIGDRPPIPDEKSDYSRYEIYENNTVAQSILHIIEQFDRALIVLESRVKRGFSIEKYRTIVEYFTSHLKKVLNFPYQQNDYLNKKLMHLSQSNPNWMTLKNAWEGTASRLN